MSDLEMKSFGPFEIKSEDRGEVVAVVATLGVVDKDGDVILPGSLPPGGAKVKLSGFDHDTVLKNVPPVGRGVMTEEGDKLIVRGKFFLSTERGREAFNYVREMGADGEWSFGFPRATKNADLTDEWRTKGAKRLIAGMAPFEASPVFVGAGWGTGTVLTKAAEPEETGASHVLFGNDDVTAGIGSSMSGEDVPEPVVTRIIGDGGPIETLGAQVVVSEVPAEPVETEEQKSAREFEAQLKLLKDDAMEEFHRVQRALKRMGYAA